MNKTKVYDAPTRLFHWLFAGLFLGAFAIAKLTDDESAFFSQHMLLGMLLTALTLLRILWGVVGSRYARFTSFPLNPKRLIEYFRDILTSKRNRHLAHNPASAWAALLMMGLALGLGSTGYLMATGHKKAFEDVHELLANAFIFVVVAHVAGVALHQIQHKDGIALSMINGKKDGMGDGLGIAKSHKLVAIGMAGILGVFAFSIYKNYDSTGQTTSLFGTKLQLGENESEKHGEKSKSQSREHDEKHDGDDD